jgi:predicted nucleotidyltransferase
MSNEELLQAIKKTVQAFVPEAEVILYGSRARGDAEPESDWDLLVLTEEPLELKEKDKIREALYRLELETDEVLVAFYRSKADWNSPRQKVTAFYENVEREGLRL